MSEVFSELELSILQREASLLRPHRTVEAKDGTLYDFHLSILNEGIRVIATRQADGAVAGDHHVLPERMPGYMSYTSVIAVAPQHQGKGLGRPLIVDLHEALRSRHGVHYFSTNHNSYRLIKVLLELGYTRQFADRFRKELPC